MGGAGSTFWPWGAQAWCLLEAWGVEQAPAGAAARRAWGAPPPELAPSQQPVISSRPHPARGSPSPWLVSPVALQPQQVARREGPGAAVGEQPGRAAGLPSGSSVWRVRRRGAAQHRRESRQGGRAPEGRASAAGLLVSSVPACVARLPMCRTPPLPAPAPPLPAACGAACRSTAARGRSCGQLRGQTSQVRSGGCPGTGCDRGDLNSNDLN